MKKLFLLLLIALPMLVACGDDDENGNGGKEEPVYLDNKLIEGRWYYTYLADSTIYIFENNRMIEEIYNKYTHNLWQPPRDYGMYRITETEILAVTSGFFYRLDKDSLFLRGANTSFRKHIRLKDQEASL